MSVLKAHQPLSHDNVFPIYIYLYVSDQSVFIGSQENGKKKITGFCQKRVQFGDFFLKILFVYHLASHPLVRMHPKKDRSNQRKQAKMINQ